MKFRLGPVSRISMGLVSLAAFLLLTADLLLGLMPDQSDIARQVRKHSAESLAVQLAALVQQDQFDVLRRTLHAVISRDSDVLSIAVRRKDGEIMAETGNHVKHWSAPSSGKSTLTNVLVPISSSQGVWGQIEVAYRPIMPRTLLEWLKYPGVGLTLLMLTLGFLLFYSIAAHSAAVRPERRHSGSRAHRLRRAVRGRAGDRQAGPRPARQQRVPAHAPGRRAGAHRQAHQ
jgi:hypothetical protein